MGVYVYSVRWYCDYMDDGGKMMTSSGVVAAESMGEATDRLVGSIFENVEEVHLYVLEGSDSGYIALTDLNGFTKEQNLVDEE